MAKNTQENIYAQIEGLVVKEETIKRKKNGKEIQEKCLTFVILDGKITQRVTFSEKLALEPLKVTWSSGFVVFGKGFQTGSIYRGNSKKKELMRILEIQDTILELWFIQKGNAKGELVRITSPQQLS